MLMKRFGARISSVEAALTASLVLRCGPCQHPTFRRRNTSTLLIALISTSRTYSNSYLSTATSNTFVRHASSTTSTNSLSKTPLYDLHIAHGGTMVGFGGYEMPVQYSSLSISASHLFTRKNASLFDVSHMLQHSFTGPGTAAFLERITPSDLSVLPALSGGLSVMLWPKTGGIVDDTMITRLGSQSFYVVTNAGCRLKDTDYLRRELQAFEESGGETVKWEMLNNHGLLALQGPLSEKILANNLVDGQVKTLRDMYFSQCRYMKLRLKDGSESTPLLVTRGGYTGEDGFEISVPHHEIINVAETLLQNTTREELQLAGLGARDSLRLEAGLCLYGHDINDSTTPVEAGLSWVIGKSRRSTGDFNGAEVIIPQLTPPSKGGKGVTRRRVGLIVEDSPAREGATIVDTNGTAIGNITSGCPSPSLNKNICMGYISDGFHRARTNVEVIVRGKKRKAQVTKMPFLPAKYWREPASA